MNILRTVPYFPCSASIDPPEFPPEVEPQAMDYFVAKEELGDQADLLGEYLADIAEEFVTHLYRTNDRFRERAQARFEAWINNRAQKLAEERAERDLDASLQDEADARS